MQLASTLRHWFRFLGQNGGSVAVVFSVSLPIVIGGVALGSEVTYWYYRHLQLQSAADSSAYAAAIEKRAGSNYSIISATANRTAVDNSFVSDRGSIEVNTPPKSGPNTGAMAVEVVLSEQVPRYFTAIFNSEPITEKVRAVARYQNASDACILALNGSASKAALFSGNTDIKLINCSVMSNSSAPDSLKVQGSAKVATECLIAAGGVEVTSGASMSDCKAPITYAPPVADPFADLAAPTTTGNCRSSNGNTLQDGKYCNGLTLKGAVTLKPGVYVISGGDLQVNANANISGTGVTFYLVGGARVSMNGNATVNLSAPTSGDYSGMLFFGDRSSSGGTNTFNGTAASKLTGAIYFASQGISYLGNFSGDGGCTQIVGDTIEWSGSTSISQDCSSRGMHTIPVYQLVKLVE